MTTARRIVLALDQGTTGSAALVFDTDGQPLGQTSFEISSTMPSGELR